MTFREPTLPSPQELRNKSYHKGYMAADGTRVRFQGDDDWAKQHLLEGDGLLPLFFDHLGKVDRAHQKLLRGVFLPDTITFNNSFPRCWQYSDDGAEIVKRPGRDLDARTIFEDFTERRDKTCDIIAEYHYVKGALAAREQVAGSSARGASARRRGAGTNPPDTCVEFLTKETLFSFLNSPTAKPDGILQRFVVPKGKASSRHNFQLQAVWSPVVTLVYKRTNRFLLTDPTIGVSQRAPTFDGPPHLSTESLVAGSTLNRIDIICRAIADHITQTEKKPVERIVAYFKEDDRDRLWLLWASSVRVGGDALNPVHNRQPMNLALRVSTIRTVLPKAEAAKANAESKSEDSSLLQCDVKVFDMTGDKDFARKCGGDLFPVGEHHHHHHHHGGDHHADQQEEHPFADGDGAESESGSKHYKSKAARDVSGWSAGSGMTSQLHPTASPPRSGRKDNSNNNSFDLSGGGGGGTAAAADVNGNSPPSPMSRSSLTASGTLPRDASARSFGGGHNNNNNNSSSNYGIVGSYTSSVDGEKRPILTPMQLLERMEREKQMAETGGSNAVSPRGAGRVSPGQSPRSTSLSATAIGGGSDGNTLACSSSMSGPSSARRGHQKQQLTPRRPGSSTSNTLNNTTASRAAAGSSSNATAAATEKIYISPRAPFLALNHPLHAPTLTDSQHPFHRAMEKVEAKERKADAERNLNREVGRSARRPPAAMVLLPGYREHAQDLRRRRASFDSSSRPVEDTEHLKEMLERAALDVIYEAHSNSMASAKIIMQPFAVPLPPLLATCLNEDELVSLCHEMKVGNARFEAHGDSVRAVVYVEGGVLGKGTQLVGKGRPLVQIVDEVKEFLRILFETNGQTLWDRYCGGAS